MSVLSRGKSLFTQRSLFRIAATAERFCTDDVASRKPNIDMVRLNSFIRFPKSSRWSNPETVKKYKEEKKQKKLRRTKGEKKNWDGYELTADHVFWERHYRKQRELSKGYLTNSQLIPDNLAVYTPKMISSTATKGIESDGLFAPWQKWVAVGSIVFMLIGYLTLTYTFKGDGAKAEGLPLKETSMSLNSLCSDEDDVSHSTCKVT